MNDRIRAMQADAILRQDEERQRLEAERQRVRVNLSGRAVAPAAAAAADQARRRLGLPAGPVPDPIVEKEASIESTMQSLSDHHKSIRWLSSPPNAAVASDRVEELTAMEKASNLMRWNSQQAWSLPGRFIGAGVADYLGMGLEGLGIAAERVTDRVGASATGEVGTWQWATGLNALNMAGGFLRDVGAANRNAASYFRGEENSEQYLRAGRPDLLNRIEKPEGVAGFALDVAGGLGQVGGAIATAPISVPLLYGSGISQANESVEEAQKREGREGQYSAGDDTALLAGGLVTGLSERLGINAIMGRLPKPIQDRIKGRIGQFLVAGVTEGATEVAEGVGQNAISAALGNDQSILDGSLVYEGGVGAVVGSVANALIQTAIPGRQNQIDAGRAAEAAQKSAAFQQMVEASVNSELRQRSPERYESFLSDVTDGAEVFIPAEKVAEFFQSNADLDQWMDEWDIRDQVQEALVAGTDVVMPMSTYLARVAPTEAHSAWANDVRFGMGSMSANEASDFAKNNAESLAASIDLAIDSALAASPAIDAAMRVEADVRSQLREAGYTVDAANRQAALVASRYQARAEAMPDTYADAWQAYQQTNLTVRQEFPDIVRQNMDRVDVMLEALRRGRAQPSQSRVFGRSMMEFLSARGGVQDSGGELAAMNVEAWHRPKEGGKAFRRRFTRQGDVREGAFEFDGATQAAIEAGYLPEGSTQTELLAAIREELAGRPTFSQQNETDLGAVENAAALDQLERLIGDLGLDLSADNATIKAALDRAADSGDVVSEGAATFDQAPADINSPEFKAWFGDSKVVDASGNPLVVYHGTNAEFDVFDIGRAGQTDPGLVGVGIYLSPDQRLAEGYGDNVIGAYASVTNPYVITDGTLPDGRSLLDAHGGALTEASAGSLNDEIRSSGHDGVIFMMDGEISQVVAFDPTQIKSVNNRGTFDANDPVIYNQDQQPRGQVSLSDSGAVIRLFAGRDLSTFTHEMGHVWLNELIFDATQDNAPQRLKDDLQTVLDWFSAEAGRTISVSDIGVDQHELWARGVERYVMEGKSPSLSLREVFRTMAAWMKSIYRTVSNLNSPISDEVRGVMDRLIASDAEIEQARIDSGSSLGADVLAQMGATDAEVSAYRANVDRARSEAEDELLGQVMRAVRRQRSKEWREAADAMREEVAAQVDMDADLTALDVIKNHGAMDREAVVAIMGDAAGLTLLPKRVPPIYSDKGGQHPDMVAQAAGYRTGMEMLNALMDYQVEHENNKDAGWKKGVRAKRIEDRIREALLDRYGDILNDGSIEQEALDAIHSERYAELLGVDLQVLGRRIGQAPAPIDAIRQWARDRIGGRTVREIRPANYLRAERKASNDTQRALASNDREAAFRHKQAQAINNALYMASSKAKRETDAVVRRLRKLGSKRSPGIHVDYMEQIDAILEQFELRRVSGVVVQRRQSLAAFIAEQKAAGNEINIPPAVVEASSKQNIEDLTVDEIMALGEVVSSLEHLGRLKKKLKVGQEQRDLDRVVSEAVEVAERAPNVKRRAVAGQQTRREEAMTFVESLEVSLVKAQEFMRILDDGDRLGVFHAVLDRRGVEAADLKSRLQEEFWSPVDAAYKAIPDPIKKAWMDQVEGHPFLDPNTGEELAMKRIDLLGAALHVGTQSNFEKMAKGYGLIRPDADPVQVSTLRTVFVGWLEQRLDATEWDYVQSIWGAHERLRPQYFAVARDIEGYEPDPVEAAPVVLAGRTLTGGYAPISYNPDLDRAAAIREQADAADIFGGVMSAGPRPDNGSTNARSGYVGAVDLRLSSARSSAEKHITYTAYAEYVQNSLKFLRHPDIAKVMKAKIGDAGYNTFEPWIAAQVKADMDMDANAKTYVKLLRGFRTNMTAATMLGSFTVLTAQPGGLAQSVTHLGAAKLSRGISTSVRLMTSGKFRDFITSRSEFMRLRLEEAELEHEFRQAMKASRTGEDALAKARVVTGNIIAWVDFYGVAGATWIAGYEGAIAEGKSETDAAYIADHAVRFTQGGARAIDHAGIQRTNNEFVKATVMFYGWANAFYNMQRSYLVDFKNGKDRTENAVALASVLVLPALLDAFMSGDWPDWMAAAVKGELPEDWMAAAQDTGAWFSRNVVFNVLAGVPIGRDISSTAERKVAGEYTSGVSQTPMARVLNEGFKLGDDMWKLATEGPDAVSSRWSGRLIGTFGMLAGVPGTTQIVRTTNYLQDVVRGDQNPDSAMDWMVGLLRGPQKDQK